MVGSNAGADKDPAWVHNLRKNPQAQIEVGTDEYQVVASELPAGARDVAFERIVAELPNMADYQAVTSRVIPIVKLSRRD